MANMKKLYMWPIWVLALGSQAKSFRDNPVIGSPLLNRLGLHVLRVLLAHLSSHFRWLCLSPLMPRLVRNAFHRNGFILIEDFIDADTIQHIRKEITAYNGKAREMVQGDTATQRILLDGPCNSMMPIADKTATGSKLRRYLAYCGGKWSHSVLYAQRIHNGFRTAGADPQKNMHSDTFHPSMKAWLFLEDVTEAKGPFTYVPGSNRLTWKRLKWEYKRSVYAADMNDKYSEKGSLRADDNALREMDLPNPRGITAKAGTLVIANTNGFHGRGQAGENASRLELWAYSRHNPFSPWPGLPLGFVLTLKHKIMHWNWHRLDRRAAERGNKPSWQAVDADKMVSGYRSPERPSDNLAS